VLIKALLVYFSLLLDEHGHVVVVAMDALKEQGCDVEAVLEAHTALLKHAVFEDHCLNFVLLNEHRFPLLLCVLQLLNKGRLCIAVWYLISRLDIGL
jgi:hypothetical protein